MQKGRKGGREGGGGRREGGTEGGREGGSEGVEGEGRGGRSRSVGLGGWQIIWAAAGHGRFEADEERC